MLISEPTMSNNALEYAQAPLWERGTVELICRQVIQETPDIRTFVFQKTDKTRFHFKPGQFMTLAQELDGEMVYRSYTISSTPSRPYTVNLTIQRVEGGRMTGWLFDNLVPGKTIHATGPDGGFNLIDIPAKKVLFLSASCGVTPMMSMSRWLLDTCTEADIRFIHCAASKEDIVFRREQDMLKEQFACFNRDYVLEDKEGLLDGERLQQLAPDLHSRKVYICGSPGFIDAVRGMLEAAQFDMSNFHHEHFTDAIAQDIAERTESVIFEDGVQFEVSLEKTGAAVTVDPNELMLDTLLGQQVPVIAACRTGVCGACKVKVVEGEVESTSQMTLTPEEIEQGYVLSCCSRPRSDVRVDI